MTSMRGPGPDWNIQTGFLNPVADAGENARRIALHSFPTTGHLLWGSSFDENLAELSNIDCSGTGYIQWTDEKTNTGPGSIKMVTGSNNNDYALFNRHASPFSFNKLGVELYVYPKQIGNGNATGEFRIYINENFPDKNLFINSGIKITREAGPVTKLYYVNGFGSGAPWIDTGINIGGFLSGNGDAFSYTWFRRIKFVVDPTKNPPMYSYLEIDGVRYDLSSIPSNYQASTMPVPQLLGTVELMNTNVYGPWTVYVDDMNITDVEP